VLSSFEPRVMSPESRDVESYEEYDVSSTVEVLKPIDIEPTSTVESPKPLGLSRPSRDSMA
jgi:hypothetical protein